MKTYKNLYQKLCSYSNLEKAFIKARKNKTSKFYVKQFEERLEKNLTELKKELENLTYRPEPLTKFVIRDPKTRTIRKSIFRDRIVHHAIVIILEPIFEKRFISDSYANRINKGTIAALKRFDKFKRKVSKNGKLVNRALNNNMVAGYCFKADIKQFFDCVNQKILLDIISNKIRDRKTLGLINKILKNYDNPERGMPLGNMTSQFFANVYLNGLDHFIKNKLKMKYYIRYVDDFVILHESKEMLENCKEKIAKYLKNLRLELHQDKSKIFPIYKGVNLLGFKVFYHYKLVRKRNINHFKRKLKRIEQEYNDDLINKEKAIEKIQGWFAYIMWGSTYNLRKKLAIGIIKTFGLEEDREKLDEVFKLRNPYNSI